MRNPIASANQTSFGTAWRIQNSLRSLGVIFVATTVLFFLHFNHTKWHPARRAVSALNRVDFSWRNRVRAWQGALQITAEHPWSGPSRNQPRHLYEYYYLSPTLTESAAIEMNDYLMLGTMLGIGTLFCFGMYVWLSLMPNFPVWNAETGKPKEGEVNEANGFSIVCHAAAIVLLVGFWFDGGLFKLPTASTFWILLGMGAV